MFEQIPQVESEEEEEEERPQMREGSQMRDNFRQDSDEEIDETTNRLSWKARYARNAEGQY